MKSLLLVIAVAAVAFALWTMRNPSEKPPAEQPQPIAMATPEPAAHPIAALPPVATPPPPPPKQLAPDGIYFLVERVSVATDSGITAAPPGTKVSLVRAGPPMRVTDGRNEFDVAPTQITNDLDIAAQVSYADRAAQAGIASIRAKQVEESERQRQQAETEAREAQQQIQSRTSTAPTSISSGALNQASKRSVKPDSYDKQGNPIWKGQIH